jgi:hypothetical protein
MMTVRPGVAPLMVTFLPTTPVTVTGVLLLASLAVAWYTACTPVGSGVLPRVKVSEPVTTVNAWCCGKREVGPYGSGFGW